MTTITSFSNKSRFLQQYKFSLRQNAGYFGMAALLIFLFYPLQYLMEVFKKLPEYTPEVNGMMQVFDPYANYSLFGIGRNFTDISIVIFTMIFLLLPFVLSLMLNSYMHSKKASDVYHSLPIRRETMLGVNAAVAMTIIIVPLVISNIIIALVALSKFGTAAPIGYQLLDMICWIICAFLIYAITTCISTQVGTVFDTFLFSGVAFFILPLLVWTFILLGQTFLYGFVEDQSIWHLALLLSPVLFPIERMMYNFDQYRFGISDLSQGYGDDFIRSNIALVIYLIIAVGLVWLAMRLYSRRHSERAETTTSHGVIATAVQLLVTVLGGIYAGILFYAIGNTQSKFTYFIWCLIGSIVTFIVIEVILNRGFKTLRKRLPFGGIMIATGLLASVIMMTGGLGYETRVPNPESLDAVEISWVGYYQDLSPDINQYRRDLRTIKLTSKEAIQVVVDFHKQAATEQFQRLDENEIIASGKIETNTYIIIDYKKPVSMRRRYSSVSSENLAKLLAIETTEEFQKQANPFFLTKPEEILSWTIEDMFGSNRNTVTLSAEENKRLLQAIQDDYLNNNVEKMLHPNDTVTAHLTLMIQKSVQENYHNNDSVYELYTPITNGKAQRVLRELNLLPPIPDITDGNYIGAEVNTNLNHIYRTDNIFHQYINGSMIQLINHSQENGSDAYQRRQWENENMANDPFEAKRNITQLIESPKVLANMAENIVPSWKADEFLIGVTFYSKNGEYTREVLVPISRLSVDVQNNLIPKN